MSIIYIEETRYYCRLDGDHWILNPYTPVSFGGQYK